MCTKQSSSSLSCTVVSSDTASTYMRIDHIFGVRAHCVAPHFFVHCSCSCSHFTSFFIVFFRFRYFEAASFLIIKHHKNAVISSGRFFIIITIISIFGMCVAKKKCRTNFSIRNTNNFWRVKSKVCQFLLKILCHCSILSSSMNARWTLNILSLSFNGVWLFLSARLFANTHTLTRTLFFCVFFSPFRSHWCICRHLYIFSEPRTVRMCVVYVYPCEYSVHTRAHFLTIL